MYGSCAIHAYAWRMCVCVCERVCMCTGGMNVCCAMESKERMGYDNLVTPFSFEMLYFICSLQLGRVGKH